MDTIKVCVRVPKEKKEELLLIAKNWRDEEGRGPGWDAKIIHKIAREKFGGLQKMFEHHGWPERGSEMMRFVQSRVKERYGSVEDFEKEYAR